MRHPHFSVEDYQRIKESIDALPLNLTDEEADRVLQEHGTSAKEVVNGFIEQLLRERLALQKAAEVALRCLQGNGDKTIEQVKDQLRAALHPQPQETKRGTSTTRNSSKTVTR